MTKNALGDWIILELFRQHVSGLSMGEPLRNIVTVRFSKNLTTANVGTADIDPKFLNVVQALAPYIQRWARSAPTLSYNNHSVKKKYLSKVPSIPTMSVSV